jgi:hypothetical protein
MSAYKNDDDCPLERYYLCAYPSCNHKDKKINKDVPFVQWHGVDMDKEDLWDKLSPIAKLAEVSNLEGYVAKYGRYYTNLELHPECAAEWGMHLIKDAIEADPDVARKMRGG